jgi:hypothetical protein
MTPFEASWLGSPRAAAALRQIIGFAANLGEIRSFNQKLTPRHMG